MGTLKGFAPPFGPHPPPPPRSLPPSGTSGPAPSPPHPLATLAPSCSASPTPSAPPAHPHPARFPLRGLRDLHLPHHTRSLRSRPRARPRAMVRGEWSSPAPHAIWCGKSVPVRRQETSPKQNRAVFPRISSHSTQEIGYCLLRTPVFVGSRDDAVSPSAQNRCFSPTPTRRRYDG